MDNRINILWVDDEIELLKGHIFFLEDKGYRVTGKTNGQDAIDTIEKGDYDIVFLDENMPGMSGLETLAKIKQAKPYIKAILITKSEEENLMEEAIGDKIDDYLIKPVNPKQILLSVKKLTEDKRLIKEKTTSNYQQKFQQLFLSIQESDDPETWKKLYKELVYWELELDHTQSNDLSDILNMQKKEANQAFCKFFEANYVNWLQDQDKSPILSDTLLAEKVFPKHNPEKPSFLILIDNLRFDQWKIIEPTINQLFKLQEEDLFYGILPTTTQYSRNAIFSGLLPSEIQDEYPQYWVNEGEGTGLNLFEKELLEEQLKRYKLDYSTSYHKITNYQYGKNLEEEIYNLLSYDLNVIVYNFVDMLSHARTEIEVLKELANDEKAYRSLTKSWFEHSPLYNILKKLSKKDINLFITTDHGSVKVNNPSKTIGDRFSSTNPRYKQGKNLQYEEKDVFVIDNPADIFLPKLNMSTKYIFAKESTYLLFPKNYNHFVNYYRNTIQHGGVSLEEILVPIIHYSSNT